MPVVNRNALVMYSAEQMYNLVNDVAQYPQFLPGCVATQVLEQAANHMLARVNVKKAGISQSFTTRNELHNNERIVMNLVDGPFKQLTGIWQFCALDQHACKVSLSLQFEFSSKLVELAFGKIFNEMANNMVSAFVQRAKIIYGSTV